MTALSRVRAALSAGERPSDDDVRAVCAAAVPRNPTPAMIRAGRRVVLFGRIPDETPDQWIDRFWRDMLDAALREPK